MLKTIPVQTQKRSLPYPHSMLFCPAGGTMVHAQVLTWISFAVLVFTTSPVNGIDVGVNWGDIVTDSLVPKTIVEMLKANGINKVKLYDSDPYIVGSLSGIDTIIGIPNYQLKRFMHYDHAKRWVKKNVTKHLHDGGVNIQYVAVGDDPLNSNNYGLFMKSTFPALKNVQKALDSSGHGDKIKATIPFSEDIYESINNKPSTADFRKDIRPLVMNILEHLNSTNSLFLVKINPFLSVYGTPNFPLDFAFFDGGNISTNDKRVQYTNVFDANFDSFVWSLKKAGLPDMKIIVGEVGWPTDADVHATVELAQRFYGGFMKKMAKKTGTPLRPGPLEVYLFSLIDESTRNVVPGNFERHWGIFRYDGQPKFPLDLSGQGQEKYPVAAKVKYLQSQWCVFDKKAYNRSILLSDVAYACSIGDCTPLGNGSSCGNLDFQGNISYAFNIYFQTLEQSPVACNFSGLASITKTNASQNGCLFPIGLQSASEKLTLAFVTNILLVFIVMALI